MFVLDFRLEFPELAEFVLVFETGLTSTALGGSLSQVLHFRSRSLRPTPSGLRSHVSERCQDPIGVVFRNLHSCCVLLGVSL